MVLREISVAGVLISPLVPLAVACWLALTLLRVGLRRQGLMVGLAAPAWIVLSLFVILFSTCLWVLGIGAPPASGH